jgi:predicted MFS family arabinose efflux permease
MPRLNEPYGWRGAVIGLGLSTVLIGLPIVLWLFREPRPEQRPAPSDKDAGMRVGATTNQAMGELRFWLIIVSVALVALAYGGLYSNYVPLLMDKGYDAKTAGGIAGVIGISIIVGRLVAGYLIDRFWAPFVAFPMLALQFLVCWQLRAETVSPEMATVCACLIGLAAGIETDIIAYLAARYYGLKNYGKIYGILYMPFGLATAISAPLYGWVFDQYKTYNPALFVAAIFFVLGGLLLLLIGKYPDLKEKYGISST